MAQFFQYLTPLLMVIVAIILGLGLWNMARGGSPNRSQKFMRYRILAQAAAVIAMVAVLYFSRS
ncbi:MAG: twin transmembrane helix small protein [Rhizobiaceae bacterium]|nr:twin transmembrane helix small protein [Rhizobiaceae bacterium]MBL4695873.1 twin transmembrane helix small protein [Rhizobiaceae bacterium]